ncbi:MAG TPA: MerR family transcriptional regulator, partial [Candidatus Magasanikbacteria bacterium]|nr:MerR family transcriptional regulator [Candidatus Magasanikbacteria bacterium]
MSYTVHSLAQLAGISVRTLHYYDQIGLLKPSVIKKNGYRYYEEAELIRLQQILFFRELEFALEDIKHMLNRPGFNVVEALKDQKKLIRLKQSRLEKLIYAIDNAIKTMNNNHKINEEELYDVFKDDDVKQYQDEVKSRWGNSDAYRQSMAKVGKMTKKEMDKLKADGKKHTQAIADAMDKGIEHPDVQKLIKQSHEGVNFFYECSYEMFRNLGKMYVDDPRFAANYDKFRPGLAVFMRDAIVYYCDQHEN